MTWGCLWPQTCYYWEATTWQTNKTNAYSNLYKNSLGTQNDFKIKKAKCNSFPGEMNDENYMNQDTKWMKNTINEYLNVMQWTTSEKSIKHKTRIGLTIGPRPLAQLLFLQVKISDKCMHVTLICKNKSLINQWSLSLCLGWKFEQAYS